MANLLHLQDPNQLAELNYALERFASQGQSQLQRADREMEVTKERLVTCRTQWQRRVREAHLEVQQAQAALRFCQASGSTDRRAPPDCTVEARALVQATRHLNECQGELQRVEQSLQRFEQTWTHYRRATFRLYETFARDIAEARRRLIQLKAKYEAVHDSGNISSVYSHNNPPPPQGNRITRADFTPELKHSLHNLGIDDFSNLKSYDGDHAEVLVQQTLSHIGLPDGTRFAQVIPGQFEPRHGIDLIGVTQEGTPYVIEVKKRANPLYDKMGGSGLATLSENYTRPKVGRVAEICEETKLLRTSLLKEQDSLFDKDITAHQMGKLWVADRWFKLIKDPIHRTILENTGVEPQFLDIDTLKTSFHTKAWDTLFRNRQLFLVSEGKESISRSLFDDAIFGIGFDVHVLDLGE